MECPYCGTRNLPGAKVCNSCGAILHEIQRARPLPKHSTGGSGGLAGAARALFSGGRARQQCAAAEGRVKSVLEDADTRAQAECKSGTASAQTHLNLGLIHLFRDEIERAVQEFQQAQKAGASGAEFCNNAGIGLARRGHLTQAQEMFPRALRAAAHPAPHANAAHILVRLDTGANADGLARALSEAQASSSLDKTNPAHDNRLGQIFCAQAQYPQAQAAFAAAEALAQADPHALADAQNNRGVAFALAGDLANAAAQFTLALERDPAHGRALANQGLLMLSQGDYDGALERLHRAARIDPHSALVRNAHGVVLSRLLAINEGIREFKEAIGLDTHTAEPLFNQAKSYADEGLFDIAERYLARAASLAPRSWEVLTVMGAVKIGMGQFAAAVQALQAARALRPGDISLLTTLGVAHALGSNDTAALAALEEASRLAPQDTDTNLFLSWLFLRQGQTSAAAAEVAIALEHNEHLALGHHNAGLCEMEMGHFAEALRHFRRAQQLEPGLASVHYELGCVYAQMNEIPSAIKEWEQSVKDEPGYADAYVNLGVAYYKAGKMEQAVAEFRRVITIRQNRLDDFSNLGLAYAKQGMTLKAAAKKTDDPHFKQAQEKHKQAIEMFDRALALQATNVMLHSNRGLACYFANRPEDAMKEWAYVSRLDPGYARRRAAKQQSEFDETQVNFVPLNVRARAARPPLKTPDYLTRYAFSYDLDDWDTIAADPALASVPALLRQFQQCERIANAG